MSRAVSMQAMEAIGRAERDGRRARLAWRLSVWSGRAALVLGFLAAWQLSAGRLLDDSVTSSPVRVAAAWWSMASGAAFYNDIGATAFEFAAGWSAGVVLAIVLACALVLSKSGYRLFEPFLLALYGIPMVALGPLLLMWFGAGMLSKIVLAAQGAFTIVLLNAVAGMRSTNPQALENLRLIGAGRLEIFRLLLLPTAAPFILTSLRLTVATAMVGVILGEFLGSVAGLGHAIQDSATYLAVDQMLAGIFTVILLTCAFQAILIPLERWGQRYPMK